jgi:hypothetical protein
MDYLIKLDQKTLMFVKHLIAQRPYAEVSALLNDIEKQQAQQDETNATPINQLQFGE